MASWDVTTVPSDSNGSRTITREFEWTYDGETYSWGTEFPQQIYDVQTRRHRIYDYGAYVADRYTQEFFADLAAEIESVASEKRWTQADIAAFASRFVQSYPYTSDTVSTGYNNYPRYPIETVVDETGDCEDTSLLLAAILYMLDYRVALLEFDSHLGVGVELRERPGNITFNGIPYTYIEPTDTGWDLGQLPSHLDGASVECHHIEDSPTLYVNWNGKTRGETFECSSTVLNLGEGLARDVVFQVRLYDRSGGQVGALEWEHDRLNPGYHVEWTDRGYVESGRAVTAEWVLGMEGNFHDQGEVR